MLWEERNKEEEEEVVEFRKEEGGEVRVLGSWVSANTDVSSRIRRDKAVAERLLADQETARKSD